MSAVASASGRSLVMTASAPVLIVDAVIGPTMSKRVIDHAARGGWLRSPMIRADADGNPQLVPDREVKARHDHRLADAALTSDLQTALVQRLLPIVAASFGHAPRSHEAFKIVRYDVDDGWFTPHRDNVTPDAAHRKFAVTVNLDDGYSGGTLRYPDFGDTEYCPAPGSAIVFACGLLHEVTPVTAGVRHAVITFLW